MTGLSSTFVASNTTPPADCGIPEGMTTPGGSPVTRAKDINGNGYSRFLDRKRQLGTDDGFDPHYLPDFLFPFQAALIEWAVRKGRAAIFADCGLGKTPMQLVWAKNVHEHTGKPVLIATPLAVTFQAITEAEKFGIDAAISRDGSIPAPITVTNYERLEKFDADRFAGMVCDESSAIKSFDGQRRAIVTEFMRLRPYRLLCTATAAPNDYIELGTSSEALGQLGHMDMLGRFFTNKMGNSTHGRAYGQQAQWRFKGHAEDAFWRWVASWARAMRRPSDLGFSDQGFDLPPLEHEQHIVEAVVPRDGALFDMPASNMHEEREEQRRTIEERCERVAELIADADIAVAWCQLNAEGDRLTRLIDGAVQVKGADSPDAKEEALRAFSQGQIRTLVTKPAIGAWGLNWQHCNRMTFFPTHSYEQYYQAVRRCWRFGQTRPVRVDLVTTEGSSKALANLRRKAGQADRMFEALVAHMNDALHIERDAAHAETTEVPAWLS